MDELSKPELLGLIAMFPVTFLAAGKWLISDYIRVTREQREQQIKDIKKDVNNIGQKVRDMKELIKEGNDRFANINTEIGKLTVHIENITGKKIT